MKIGSIDVRHLADTLGNFTQTWKSGKAFRRIYFDADPVNLFKLTTGRKNMELIVFVIAVGLIVAAYFFGRNVLSSLRGINEKLYSIRQENSNIQDELHEVKVLLEAKSGQKAKEIMADELRKSMERATAPNEGK